MSSSHQRFQPVTTSPSLTTISKKLAPDSIFDGNNSAPRIWINGFATVLAILALIGVAHIRCCYGWSSSGLGAVGAGVYFLSLLGTNLAVAWLDGKVFDATLQDPTSLSDYLCHLKSIFEWISSLTKLTVFLDLLLLVAA